MPINIMVADDHEVIIAGVTAMINGIDEFELSCIALTPEEAIFKYCEHKPDVLLCDIRFNEDEQMGGFTIAESILNKKPDAKIIFYSQFDSVELIKKAYEMGIKSFLSKGNPKEFIPAIKEVANGNDYYPVELMAKIGQKELAKTKERDPKDILTEDEFKVFMAYAQGAQGAEIAESTGFSRSKISPLKQNIQKKLNTDRTPHFTILAFKYGHIQASDFKQS